MQRRYRVDEIEIFRHLRVAVVASPGTPYRILVELQRGVAHQRRPNTGEAAMGKEEEFHYLEQV